METDFCFFIINSLKMCQRVQTMCCAVLPSSRIKTSSPSPKAVFPKRQTISYIFSEGTQHREGEAGSAHCSCGVNSSCAPEHFVKGETWARGPTAAEKSLVWLLLTDWGVCGRKIFLHIKQKYAAFKNNKRCMWEIWDKRKKTGTKRHGENF